MLIPVPGRFGKKERDGGENGIAWPWARGVCWGHRGAHRGVAPRQRGQCPSTNTPRGSTGWAMGFISADTCRVEGGGAEHGSFVPRDTCGGEVCRKPSAPGEGSAWGSTWLPAPALTFMGPILENPTEINPWGQSSALEPSSGRQKRGEAERKSGLASPGFPQWSRPPVLTAVRGEVPGAVPLTL